MKLTLLFLLPVLSILSLLASAAEPSLLSQITQAQKHLASTEQRIGDERLKFANQLNELERAVLELRNKTAVARRLADEKTLSLSKLTERLDSWRQQQVYQQNLLHRFLQQHAPRQSLFEERKVEVVEAATPTSRIAATFNVMRNLESRFYPRWQSADIVLASGAVTSLPALAVGPVTWYWDAAKNRAGLASVHDGAQGLLHADLLLSGDDSRAIASLRQQSEGDIVFDPTLTRALVRQKNSESLLEHIMKGGLWAVPIILFAFFALSICLVKASQLWRLPALIRFTPTALRSVLNDPASPLAAKVKGRQQRLLGIARDNHLPRQRDDQLFVQLQDDKHWLERWIGAIAITAAVSPLLGLLGTVSGMIETFKMMTLFGSGDPEVVSGGIAKALVTTELGLVVAIPALILNAILSRRAKSYYNELEGFAILLSKVDEAESEGAKKQGVGDVQTRPEYDDCAKKNRSSDTPVLASPSLTPGATA